MLQKLGVILESSRIFSLPMTILSWLVIFTYSVINSGNILYGIIALFGVCLAHLGTNVIDDYFDYKSLIKQVDFNKNEYLKNSQKTKCRYIVSGVLSENSVLLIAGVYFGLAFLIGLFLYLKCGMGVVYFGLIGGIIGILYPFLSKICMSEIAVGLTYGPAMFGGVYYVMTGMYSKEAILISLPSMFMTIVLLYIHTVMDFDYDLNENHNTIANRFDSQLDSLVVLKGLLISAYCSVVLLCILDIFDWQILLTFLTIPLTIDLYKSLEEFSYSPETVPKHKWYHFPMENLEHLKEIGVASFMIRMYQSRNLMIYFSLLLVLGIFLSLAV